MARKRRRAAKRAKDEMKNPEKKVKLVEEVSNESSFQSKFTDNNEGDGETSASDHVIQRAATDKEKSVEKEDGASLVPADSATTSNEAELDIVAKVAVDSNVQSSEPTAAVDVNEEENLALQLLEYKRARRRGERAYKKAKKLALKASSIRQPSPLRIVDLSEPVNVVASGPAAKAMKKREKKRAWRRKMRQRKRQQKQQQQANPSSEPRAATADTVAPATHECI